MKSSIVNTRSTFITATFDAAPMNTKVMKTSTFTNFRKMTPQSIRNQ